MFGYADDFQIGGYPIVERRGEDTCLGGKVFFWKDMGWDKMLLVGVKYSGKKRTMEGEMNYSFCIHKAPNIGFVAKMNQPIHLFNLFLGSQEDGSYIGIEWEYNDWLKRCLLVGLGIKNFLTPSTSLKIHFDCLKDFRFYLPNLIFRMGFWAEGGLRRKIRLEGLRIKNKKEGDVAVGGEIKFIFPLFRWLEVRIFNLMVFESVEIHLGYEGSRLFDGKIDIQREDTFKSEIVGGFCTIGGLKFGIRIGYAHSLRDERDHLYLGFTSRIW